MVYYKFLIYCWNSLDQKQRVKGIGNNKKNHFKRVIWHLLASTCPILVIFTANSFLLQMYTHYDCNE